MAPLIVLGFTAVVLVLGLVAFAALYGAFSRNQEIVLASTGDRHQGLAARARRRANQAVRATAAGRRLDLRLAGASLSLGPADFLTLVVAGALLVGLVSQPLVGYVGAIVLMIGVGVLAERWLEHQQRKRAERFVAQLPELARVLGNAAGAGLALRSGIDLVVRELEAPASEEFAEVARRLGLGTPLEDALRDLAQRLPSPELSVLVKTIVVQSRAGGALISALSSIAETLEERRELNRELKTAVTGAVFVGWLVVLIALGSVLMMNLIMPGALDKLIQTLPGQIVLVVSGALFVLGHLLIRRITRIEGAS
ncbi:MAG: type II secretion system F family protein [Propionicimonas sp.]|uniref:type II secretion system F family protein n=1 Tax=Propionicimonas sp. TaxID=1955623 RepID=UPI002B21F857|nr:type II secretion system F family protein [Propionicimonas sp.]MEA4943971.1 type II secretion system F family protein [Propionicimonas sp.]MEA5052508.1 type II secretion system F family protein [Propionicimonas sp.]